MTAPAEHWFRIITDLERHVSLRKIADISGTSHSALVRYKAGEAEPRHSTGETLIRLHRLFYPTDSICTVFGPPPVV